MAIMTLLRRSASGLSAGTSSPSTTRDIAWYVWITVTKRQCLSPINLVQLRVLKLQCVNGRVVGQPSPWL